METEGTRLRDRLEQTLGAAHVLERELVGGGMSRVFVAHDTRLGRRVVVKVLHPDLAAGISAQRFEREIRLAARLQHPHVVQLLSAGEVDGVPYYTMPFVQGESLRERLRREGALPVADALRLVRELADALAYAHAEGVVHRDLKPENVLLSGGHAVVADFGVAKAVSAATHDGQPPGETTGLGVAVGTPAYMAPEQVTGDPATDHRADLYALGVVAYELLTGAHPFVGRTPTAMFAAHLTETPVPLAERRADVPPSVAALVMRLLAKEPGNRPQTAGEVVRTLDTAVTPGNGTATRPPVPARRRRIVVAAAVGVVVASLAVVAMVSTRGRAAPTRPKLAVLPFESLGPAADAYFADGLTEEVRSRLTNVSGLEIIGGTSARLYKSATKAPREIARELGATHLLTGTVRWDRAPAGGGRVRVTPELIQVADQKTIWNEPVNGSLGDVFAMQAQVAERVAAALDVVLLARERRSLGARLTNNPAAYDAHLRGVAYAAAPNRFDPAARRAAIEGFERAVSLDSQFAVAHARLASAYLTERSWGRDDGLLEKARASLSRALALDSTLVESHTAHASYLIATDDPKGAYAALQAAMRMAPSDADVVLSLAAVQEMLGRMDDALMSYRRAEELEPRWADPPGQLAGAYDRLGRYEEAIRVRERAIAILPSLGYVHPFHAASYLLWRADTAAARRALERGEPRQVVEELTRLPSHFAGRATWLGVVPRAVIAAKDTITLAGYLREDWGTPDLFHLMKARHFALTNRTSLARAHADSVIALLERALRHGPGTSALIGLFSQHATIAEAYAYAGRAGDAARIIDKYVEDRRTDPAAISPLRLPYALVSAAYIDVLIGRSEVAVSRLEEAFGLPSGQWISRALLRADPSWAPLRGHAGFERLIAGP